MAKTQFFKTIAIIFLCAGFALSYVHQEVEIVKAGFSVNKHRQEVSFLLDQYRSLVYNLSQLESPKRIENSLCTNEIVLCMPNTENIRRTRRIAIANQDINSTSEETLLARFFDRFTIKAEAKVVE